MDLLSTAEAAAAPELRDRTDIADRYKWNLGDIFPGWDAWLAAYQDLEVKIGAYAALQGTLAKGADRLLAAMQLSDDIGQLTYKVWYYAGLKYDEDQRDNQINAKRQQVQILFAKAGQASAWFNPELLSIPLPTVQQWMTDEPKLAMYRFALEDLYRQQEHVLDEKGEHLLSLASRFSSAPNDAYAALSTADIKHPSIKLSTGPEVTLTYGQYRAILATNRNQPDRGAAFHAYHQVYAANVNTYASLYNGILQRDWFHSQSRGYKTTLDAALHGNNIPPAVVENLIETYQGRHRAAAPLSPAAQARPWPRHLSQLRHRDPAGRLRSQISVRARAGVAAGIGRAARRAVSGPHARRAVEPVDRRLREPRQAQRRLLGARLRRSPVHAPELQRHAGRGVHAGARDGALDAHHPLERAPAVRLLGLHDLHRRGAVDAQRDVLSRVHARARHRRSRTHRPAPARHRRHRRDLLHAGAVRRLRAAGASPGRGGPAGDRRRPERDLLHRC